MADNAWNGSYGNVVERWEYASEERQSALVLPDGCRDLIGTVAPSGQPTWFISALQDSVMVKSVEAGQRFIGYRLRPGTLIDDQALLLAVQKRDILDISGVASDLVAHTARLAALDEALASIQEGLPTLSSDHWPTIGERKLQRLFQRHTGKPPVFWRRLARWRKAMRWLNQPIELAEIALMAGYSDQAHMTKECRRWCGMTPQAARDAQARGDVLLAQAFA
ncbi:helix-turn-helix domain-containing protein [Hydrogenophaga sp. 5NK40-0174]|uniref:AraC family transcriptional regulator n=1 Tax=Hydrogenophaga sp. 5NK40-0174 TaxID=3127649 RepID=UPI00310615A0